MDPQVKIKPISHKDPVRYKVQAQVEQGFKDNFSKSMKLMVTQITGVLLKGE